MDHEYPLGIQLDLDDINKKKFNIEIFGNWIRENKIEQLSMDFRNALPFPHVIITDFFAKEVIEEIFEEFPDENYEWFLYHNPIEYKRALNDITKIPKKIADVIRTLNHKDFIEIISKITHIDNLMADPYLHGGGIHSYPSQGKLNIHLDYSIHPITKKERRINIIIYLNKIWKDEWGGHLELWDNIENPTFIKRLNPEYNTAVIFQTSDESYHGIPNKINCPSNFSRNSIAIFYVSEPRNNVKHRYKAKFFITNDKEKNDTRLKQLIEIRNNRRLTSKDLETIYPDWKKYF